MKTRTKRRHGTAWPMIVTVAALMLVVGSIPVSAGEVVITVKGVVASDSHDTLGIFQSGTELKGLPFTLIITFDDAASTASDNASCPASLINGSSADPARAVLKVGKGSYTLGTKPESKWDAYKDTAPHNCNPRGIGFHVMEGHMPQASNLWVTVQGPDGRELKSDASWQTPIATTRVTGFPGLGHFNITRPGDGDHAAWGRLDPQSLSIGPAGSAKDAASADATADAGDSSSKDEASTQTGQSASEGATAPPQQSLKDTVRKALGGMLPKLTIPHR